MRLYCIVVLMPAREMKTKEWSRARVRSSLHYSMTFGRRRRHGDYKPNIFFSIVRLQRNTLRVSSETFRRYSPSIVHNISIICLPSQQIRPPRNVSILHPISISSIHHSPACHSHAYSHIMLPFTALPPLTHPTASQPMTNQNLASDLKPSGTAQQKIKPCCVCTDEKAARDECMLFSSSDDPAKECATLVGQYRSCMAGFGFNM